MKIEKYNKILNELKSIITCTEWENHVFTVGGCNRDFILGREIKDIDLVVDLPSGGIYFAKWLHKNGYSTKPVTYENFGTAMFHLEKFPDVELEVVQTRSECYHDAKTRNPETSFGTLKEDWQRRDFTINAIYYNISQDELLDFDNRGQNDIKNKLIRTCGNPEIIFDEDPLRIYRMIRFVARFKDFTIDKETYDCAKKFTNRLNIISRERITDEFTKMMTYSFDSIIKSLSLMWDFELFKYTIPSFENISTYDRFCILHRIIKTGCTSGSSLKVILSRLMYEAISLYRKNQPIGISTNEYIKYMLRNCLNYSNDIINEVCLIVKENEKLETLLSKSDFKESFVEDIAPGVRRIMNECGDSDTFLTSISIGSMLVSNYFLNKDYDEYNNIFDEFDSTDAKFYSYKLPVTGEDVMEIFDIKPCKKIKEILNKTLSFVFINPNNSGREDCINFIKYLKQVDDEWNKY